MDLAELKFVVNTEDLERAAKEVANLGTEVTKLNKPMQNLTKESAKTNKELSKAEEAAAKAALAQTKLEQAQTKSTQAATKSSSVLERQNLILEYMAQGNSKGQASILATAKAAGALDDEMLALNKTLVTQRTLIGGDPFDKSIGLMQKLQNEYKTTTEVTNLFNKNLGLTEKQMTDLAREKERLIALYGIEGKSLDGLSAEYEQLIQKSVKVNQANDARTNSMKAQVKAQDDAAKANEYLAKEIERVNRLNAESKDITSATNNRLIRFEKELRASGLSAAEAASKLDAYRASLLATQKAAGNRQVDYLSRALGPQITDIFVGLYSGQAPMTVLVQQGGQLRDQFALAGVEGSKMGEMLVKAAGSMLTSIKDVGMAVGQVFVTAITGTGRYITNFAMQITGANIALDALRKSIITTDGASSAAIATFDKLGKAITVGMGIGVFAAIALLIGLVVQYSKVVAAEKELTASLAMSGAALAMSTEDAIKYAESMNAVGIGTMDAMRMIAEFANTGTDASIPLEQIIKSAQDMQKYVGIASADTMKAFADIAEKPVEGLIKLAKSTGNVTAETILQAEAAVKAGNTAEAARIAQEALSNSNSEVVKRMKNNLDPLQTLWMDIKSGISQAGEALYDFLKSSTTVAVFRTVWETIAVIVTEVWYVLKQTGNEISGIFSQIKAVMSGDFAGAARIGNQMKTDAEAAKVAQDKLVASIMNRNKAEKETLTITEDQRKANRQAAKEIEDRIKKEGKGTKAKETKELTELEKERAQFLKVMSDLEDRASGFTKNYSDQLNILNIGLTEGWLTQDQFNIKLHELNKVQPGVIKAHKDAADALEKFTQAQKKADDALFDSLDVQHQLNIQVLEQTDLLALEGSLIGATDAQRKKALATKRLDLQLEKEIAAIKKSPISASEQEAQIARARQRRVDAEKNINTEIANDAATKTLEEYNKIKDGISDSIVTALFEGGKAGRKKLRDLIVAELKKPITLVIDAIVNATLGSFINSLIGGSAGSSFAGSAAGGGISNMVIGSATLGAQAGAFGQGVASGFSFGAPVSSLGAPTSGAFNMGATYGAPVAGALAGVYGGRAISGGYSTNGGSGNSAVNAGTAIGMLIGGPLGAAIGGLAGGAFNRAFGRKLVASGIEGTLGGETGFEGNRYTFEKGGTFRSDKRRTQTLEESTRLAIANDFNALKTNITTLATNVGFSSDVFKDFSAKFNVNLRGVAPEKTAELFQQQFAAASESMAQQVMGTFEQVAVRGRKNRIVGYRDEFRPGEFMREGETALEALNRISVSLVTANTAMKHFGVTLYEGSLAGGDAASTFIDLFGGIEAFSQAMGFFYDNFFTEEEKIANLTKDLTEEFNKLNKPLPETREAFRAMVVAAKEAGDDQLVVNLMKLQYGVAALREESESTAEAMERLTESVEQSRSVLIDTYKEEISLLDAVINKFSSLRDSLLDLKDSLITSEKATTRSSYSAAFTSALSGSEKGLEDFTEEAKKFIETSKSTSTSYVDYIKDFAKVIADTSTLIGVTEEKVSEAEATKLLYQDQLTALENIEKNTLDLNSAIKDFSDKLLLTIDGGISAQVMQAYQGIGRTGFGSSANEIDVGGFQYWVNRLKSGELTSDTFGSEFQTGVQSYMSSRPNDIYSNYVRGYANGGSYPGGLALVGEKGPELINFNSSGQVYTAGQTASLLNSTDVVDELRFVREEIVMLRSEVRADVGFNAKTAKILERANQDGDSLNVSATIDGGAV
jgi:phage-related minor tail protein